MKLDFKMIEKLISNGLGKVQANDEECLQIRDKCRHFAFDVKVDPEEIDKNLIEFYESNLPEECMHGDIVTGAEKTLRSMEVYFVNCVWETCDEAKRRLKRRLVQKDLSGSGYCCVPIEVTQKIKDPLRFYENAFTFSNYDEIDFSGIQIDTKIHQNVIRQFTGGKQVHFSRKCFYFFSYNEWDSTNGNS